MMGGDNTQSQSKDTNFFCCYHYRQALVSHLLFLTKDKMLDNTGVKSGKDASHTSRSS